MHLQLIITKNSWWITFCKLTAFRISKMFTSGVPLDSSQYLVPVTALIMMTKLFICEVNTILSRDRQCRVPMVYLHHSVTLKHSFPSWEAFLATSWEAPYSLYFPQLLTRSIFLVQHLTTMCSTILSMCMSMHSLPCSLEVIIQNWYDVSYDVNIWLCLLVCRNPL